MKIELTINSVLLLLIFDAMMNFVDLVQFGLLESSGNFARWFFDFVLSL